MTTKRRLQRNRDKKTTRRSNNHGPKEGEMTDSRKVTISQNNDSEIMAVAKFIGVILIPAFVGVSLLIFIFR